MSHNSFWKHEATYPIRGRYKPNGLIVEFVKYGVGTVTTSGESNNQIGYYDDTWYMEIFEPINDDKHETSGIIKRFTAHGSDSLKKVNELIKNENITKKDIISLDLQPTSAVLVYIKQEIKELK